jgi:hypothetical protein
MPRPPDNALALGRLGVKGTAEKKNGRPSSDGPSTRTDSSAAVRRKRPSRFGRYWYVAPRCRCDVALGRMVFASFADSDSKDIATIRPADVNGVDLASTRSIRALPVRRSAVLRAAATDEPTRRRRRKQG